MKEYQFQENENNQEEKQQYLSLNNGYLDFDNGKTLKFGVGNNTIKIDNTLGFWSGNQIYSQAPVRISNAGNFILKNQSSLPTTGTVGELIVSQGTVYVCTISTPITWVAVGKQ